MRLMLGLCIAVAALPATPASLSAQTRQQSVQYSPPGRRVDIGGRFLHILCTGKGSPTVVLEAGAGDFCLDWSAVQPGVERFARVCSYDRAGFAWSDPGPRPRTARQLCMELHTALGNAGIRPPYVLVGQSFGGFLVRAFARFYPKEVAGMVLVDAMHEDSRVPVDGKAIRIRDMAKGRKAPPPKAGMPGVGWTAEGTVPLGPIPTDRTQFVPWLEKMHRWAESSPAYAGEWRDEMDWSPEDVANMYAHRNRPEYRLGNLPLTVLTRGSQGAENGLDIPAAQLEAERKAQQADLAHLSTRGRQIVAAKSGHNIQYDQPDVVVETIRQVVEAMRHNSRRR